MHNLKLLPTWKDEPIRNPRVKIKNLPKRMQLHRAIFTQCRKINDLHRFGYKGFVMLPELNKLKKLKGMIK